MEPRVLTGPAFFVLGLVFSWIVLRIWLVHPINRVFRLGPYVTERGIAAVLTMRPIFLAYALLGLTNGTTRMVYWFAVRSPNAPIIKFLGSLEAGLSVWAAFLTVKATIRLWRAR